MTHVYVVEKKAPPWCLHPLLVPSPQRIMPRKEPLTNGEKQRIFNLYKFFEKELQQKRNIVAPHKLNERVAAALKVSVPSVVRVRAEAAKCGGKFCHSVQRPSRDRQIGRAHV